ncbi:MAG: amidohydrolase family protein [Gemmatimonadetes bacterium]|nr:amidohydrolase family protein [Gemmatimonadota bacterium]
MLLALIATTATAQTNNVEHGKRPGGRLAIRNAMVVAGNGTPAEGPYDVVLENGRIVEMTGLDPVALKDGRARRPPADAEIDAAGRYLLPGLINAHAHLQNERGGLPQPYQYQFKLWLASGVTTIRDVSSGGDPKAFLELKEQSRRGLLEAPRIYVYAGYTRPPVPRTPDQARARVRELKTIGVDGIKIGGLDRDIMAAMEDEAQLLDLPIAHHIGVEETTAWDDVRFGTRSIEHWYGVPDAAFPDGVQNFPSNFNYNDETHRFRYAGRIWREADRERLQEILRAMAANNVAWDPTLVIYEASRDLQRAQNQPWFKDYLHPTLEEFFRPNPANHGSYFLGWSSTDEAFWKENYRIWMAALRDFDRYGGLIGVGEDAGFIYQMYGFGVIREMELHQEAGFHPLKVIQHATLNNAKMLGVETEIGRIRVGHRADVIIVNGNPLEDLKVLYPTGTSAVKDGKEVRAGGVEWTIKDGIPYHGPRLMTEVKDLVAKARAEGSKRKP